MYKLSNNFVKINSYDFDLAVEYININKNLYSDETHNTNALKFHFMVNC
ncbi:MAG: hypothetical protein HFI86_01715 [Bacilli bacterium]|nr:hypothetical protein [Bacilli bacterium]